MECLPAGGEGFGAGAGAGGAAEVDPCRPPQALDTEPKAEETCLLPRSLSTCSFLPINDEAGDGFGAVAVLSGAAGGLLEAEGGTKLLGRLEGAAGT